MLVRLRMRRESRWKEPRRVGREKQSLEGTNSTRLVHMQRGGFHFERSSMILARILQITCHGIRYVCNLPAFDSQQPINQGLDLIGDSLLFVAHVNQAQLRAKWAVKAQLKVNCSQVVHSSPFDSEVGHQAQLRVKWAIQAQLRVKWAIQNQFESEVGHSSPVESQVGHISPVERPVGHIIPVESHLGHPSPIESHMGHSRPIQSHVGHSGPIESQ
ncbi:hypothetical protein SAY86_001733 [Trapa natans]|uniref:Uncharacterized protein n=1 Tax=Trapa natans TaxID=22666 RepID=A0AAN7QYX4_TRANT|nr:hypothetical protein SAY86_001733 [Trapa natans]